MTAASNLLARLTKALWLRLGIWLERRDLSGIAEACYRHSMDGKGGTSAEGAFRLTQRLLARGRYRETISVGEQALHGDPGQARLWCAIGAAHRHLAEMKEAKTAYDQALSLNPGYAQVWSNLGEWHVTIGKDYESALECCDRALELDSRLMEALNNRVAALYELGRFEDAEAAALKALEVYPEIAALHANHGTILLHSGKGRAALKEYYKALECDPACAEAHLALATAFGEQQRIGEALDFLKHEIEIRGENAQRLASLAMAQKATGDLLAAESSCNKVLELQDNNIAALTTLAGVKSTRGDHWAAIRLNQRAIESSPHMPAIFSNIAFDATYLNDIPAEQIYDFHADWARNFEAPLTDKVIPAMTSRHPDRPLRIGYVSGDFGRHPVGFLLRDVAANHDNEHYSIHCYSMMRQEDEVTKAIKQHADAWIDALLLSDDELADQIREDRIDILVDLSGHTAFNRLPVFVARPAPIQVSWIGYFHSTGLNSIDYFITDPNTSPQDCGQHFSEIPVWLPYSRFCYSPPDYAPEIQPPPSLSSGEITFGSFNRIEKLTNPVIDAWAEILSRFPDSRLLLKSGGLQNEKLRDELKLRFTEKRIEGDRVELRAPTPHPLMLAEYAEVDIALDPFPFNGGMTTLESLWMGVPVVTVAGQGVVSRQTYSALANLDFVDGLAFSSLDSYIGGAIALANDPERLAWLRKELRPRMMASPLCQAEHFTRDLESLYRRMWQAYCSNEKLPAYYTAS